MRVWLPGATAALTAVPQRAGTFFWCGSITIMPILAGRSGSDPAHPLSYFFGNPSPLSFQFGDGFVNRNPQ
jgi:hypothetical protein